MKFYAGIGSRQTPNEVCTLFTNFASLAEELGWTLRSGRALGADTAFENGINNIENMHIYLPWKGYNSSTSDRITPLYKAFDYAREVIPHWGSLSQGAMKLHARNMHQLLGDDLNTPVKFVICWTPKGELKGGTATAIRAANLLNIPVFNLGAEVNEQLLEEMLRG